MRNKHWNSARILKTLLRKKLSLSVLLRREARAGMTVEAAVVLPLFLAFLLNLGSAVEMIRLHNNIQYALWDVGGRLALYGCEQKDNPVSALLTDLYVRGRISSGLGADYLKSSPLVGGEKGLQLWETGRSDSGNELDIVVTYQVGPMTGLAAFRPFRMANRCCVRLWNGYEFGEGSGEGNGNDYVYVTENGAVWHSDRDCTHISLSVREISASQLESQRNAYGGKYGACDKCCHGEIPERLYITGEGNCYHTSEACSGLKRTVTSLTLEEASGYRPCSRCAANGSTDGIPAE